MSNRLRQARGLSGQMTCQPGAKEVLSPLVWVDLNPSLVFSRMLDFPPALGSSTQQRLSRPWGLGKQNKPFSQSPGSADSRLPAPLEVSLATSP